MMWSSFNNDLHYQYVKVLTKSLSNAEQYYLRVLRDGVDNQINSSIDWINNNYNLLEGFNTSREWYDYYEDDGELQRILLTLIGDNVNRCAEALYDFYKSGGNLAYAHMSRNPVFTNSDYKALTNLSNYMNTVVESINSEFANATVQSVGEHIDENHLAIITMDLIDLKEEPSKKLIDLETQKVYTGTRLSTDNRCLFTTKTEYARAVNTGLLQAYANYNVEWFDIVTSGLKNVCKTCLENEANNPYSLDEVMELVPNHPNCVCSVKARLPVNLDELRLNPNPSVVDLTPKDSEVNH